MSDEDDLAAQARVEDGLLKHAASILGYNVTEDDYKDWADDPTMEAIVAFLRPRSWMPIETAPAGQMVLLWDGSSIYMAERSRFYEGLWDDGDYNSKMDGFTHWMPLPYPPSEAG